MLDFDSVVLPDLGLHQLLRPFAVSAGLQIPRHAARGGQGEGVRWRPSASEMWPYTAAFWHELCTSQQSKVKLNTLQKSLSSLTELVEQAY